MSNPAIRIPITTRSTCEAATGLPGPDAVRAMVDTGLAFREALPRLLAALEQLTGALSELAELRARVADLERTRRQRAERSR